ncbi:MAG: tRNA uridine(34) 5-carboxymethylaminomethyl modification radical SAM/GNAT enzyme Elp3 [Candidatus Aenigmatarchaeota archaeon]
MQSIRELIEKINSGKISSQEHLEREKIRMARKYRLNKVIKNADILLYAKESGIEIKNLQLLKTKPVRTLSGVANIAVMWMPNDAKGVGVSCPGECIYCPRGDDSPKSYTGVEPATLRAKRNNYDPFLQIQNRLKQLQAIGHATDKCELIIMGGTFLSWGKNLQELFVKRCLDAMNEKESSSLIEAQRLNEIAKHRCIGLTIETRADYCKKKHIEQILKLGCTRVEIGVQSTDDRLLKKINRGHSAGDNIKAIRLLKKAGLKVCVHWMPGLTGLSKLDVKKELKDFKKLFSNDDYRPDELKIYPTLVIPNTKLHELWKKGKYKALSSDEAINLLIEMKKIVPKYVRIKRISRDISEKAVVAGPKSTNLRQMVHKKMEKSGIVCNCIRCREVRNSRIGEMKLQKIEYRASDGREVFLSFESDNVIAAFLRLRMNGNAKIRELHVYGEMAPLGKSGDVQHRGLGKRLLEEAERIAKSRKIRTVQITSGIGAREYYRKLGYELCGSYMLKRTKTNP